MAEIDQLSIQIKADATDAEKAINGLITSLCSLNRNLNLGNVKNFSRQLKEVTSAAKGMSEAAAGIRSLASAGSSLAKLTGFKTLNDEMKATETEAKKMAREVADSFNFKDSGIKNYREGLKAFQEAIESQFSALQKNKTEWGYGAIYEGMLSNLSNSRKEIADIYEEVTTFAKGQKIYIDDSTRSWLEYTDTLKKVQAAFKDVSFDPKDKMRGYSELSEILDGFSGVNLKANGDKVADMFRTLVEYIDEGAEQAANAVVHGLDQIEKGLVPDDYFKEQGEKIAENVRAAFEKISSVDNVKNPFAGVLAGLQSLQGITLPDFSSLDVLADGLTKIQSVNAAKIQKVATALNSMRGGVATDGISQVASAAQETGNTVSEKMLPAIINVDEAMQKVANGFMRTNTEARMLHDVLADMFSRMAGGSKNLPDLFTGLDKFAGLSKSINLDNVFNTENIKKQARDFNIAAEQILQIEDKLRPSGSVIDIDYVEVPERLKLETGIIEKYGESLKQSGEAAREAGKETQTFGEKVKRSTESGKKGSIELLANLVALGHEIGNIANTFNKIGDFGIKGMKLAFKPLLAVVDEYKEKINGISDAFKNFYSAAKKHLEKLSAFWKRSMKTFTFMLVRKAITAVLTEINDATESLALWSKQFGTVFNDSMSQITSNLSYMARSIVGAFEPLINFVVPAFNTFADAVANAMAKVGEFFAALTGQDYYMKAVRQVTDYGDSVEKANKAQKNLISGLDDLNIITTPTSTAAGMDDLAGQWEKVNVSSTMKDWANAVKSGAKKLFEPIKKAWDNVGDYVIDGFKYMTEQGGKLLSDMANDFVEVWSQGKAVTIFENLLKTIGHIENAAGNLAKRFDEAWNSGGKGKSILENLRDIILIISGHVESMADSFKSWTDSIDFNPILQAVEDFTKQVQPLVDFLGNIVEDVWEKVILKYHKWFIEEGTPHFIEKINEIIAAFNFDKVREDLQPVIEAIERMAENIHTGVTNAIGNIGEAVAQFANSQDFTDFCETVAWILDQVTAERVEKLFTALGTAVIDVADALAKFVGSEKFQNFLQKLVDWYDSKSAEEIAGIIERIALAIAGFKFAAFVGQGIAGFFQFLSVVQSMSGIGGILSETTGGVATLEGAAGPAAIAVGAVAVSLYSMVESYGGVSGLLEELGTHFDNVCEFAQKCADQIGLTDSYDNLKESVDGLSDSLSNMGDFWGINFTGAEGIADLLVSLVTPAIKGFIDQCVVAVDVITGTTDVIGGLFEVLSGLFNMDSQKVVDGLTRMEEGAQLAGGATVRGMLLSLTGDFTNAADSFGIAADSFSDSMAQMETDTNETPKNLWDGFKLGWNKYFGEDGAGFAQYASDAAHGFLAAFQTIFNMHSPSVVMRDDIAGNIVQGLINGFNGKIPSVITLMQKFGKDILNKFTTAGANAKDFLTSAKNAIDGFISGIGNKQSSATSRMTNLAKSVSNAFSSEASANKFRGFAKNVVDGFVNGINAFKHNVVSPMRDFAASVWESFKDKLGISSPSKVFKNLAYWTVEGFNEGIEDNEASTQKAVNSWLGKVAKIELPQWDIQSAIPKSNLSSDLYTHQDVSGNVNLGSADISADMQSAFTEALGGLILPYLNRIEEYSRVTANKPSGITSREAFNAVRAEAKDYNMRTGREAFGF